MGFGKFVWDIVLPDAFTRTVDDLRARRTEERNLANRIHEETGRRPGRVWRRWFREQNTVDALIEKSSESLSDLVNDLNERLARAVPPWRERDGEALKRRAEQLVSVSAEGLLEALQGSRSVAAADGRSAQRDSAIRADVGRLLNASERLPRVFQSPDDLQASMAASVAGFADVLVGRDVELAALRQAVLATATEGGCRIVVLEGPGGFGKTHLAIEVARRHSAALVARTGTALTVDAFVDVPSERPALLVIDDFHRCPGVSGLSAVLGDPRFADLRIVITARPGLSDPNLASVGLARQDVTVIGVGPLPRSAIDEIVTSYGLTNDRFRTYVIGIALGSPLVAHLASRAAIETNQYSWHSTLDLMGEVLARRLSGLDTTGRQMHRAAATALAVRTVANDGYDLAAVAPAVRTLTNAPHELDDLLADLADAGIASGPPYVVQPDLLAPAIVSQALRTGQNQRIRLDTVRLLPILGTLTAGRQTSESTGAGGVFGIAPLPARREERGYDLGRLQAQLNVLVQAAMHAPDRHLITTLAGAVRELLPQGADFDTWLDVLGLAESLAEAAPELVAQLVHELERRWPIPLPSSIWNEDRQGHDRVALQQLAEHIESLAHSAVHADAEVAARTIMQKSWLIAPEVPPDPEADDPIRIAPLIGTGLPGAVIDWAPILERRARVLRTVLSWLSETSEHLSASPNGLADGRRYLLALTAFAGLKPFLTLIVESTESGTPDSPDTFILRSTVVPADETLTATGTAVANLLTRYDLSDPATESLSRAIAELPFELRAIGARGLPRADGPLPEQALQALASMASLISESIVGVWSSLPLRVRRTAAASTIRYLRDRPATLQELAAANDPIAVAASEDLELAPLLILQPLDEDLQRLSDADTADWETLQKGADEAAVELAQVMDYDEAIRLLHEADPRARSILGGTALSAFARTIGQTTDRTEDAHQMLLTGPGIGAVALLEGLIRQDREGTTAWLIREIASPRIAALALAVGNDLDENSWYEVVSAIRTDLVNLPATESNPMLDMLLTRLWLTNHSVSYRLGVLVELGRDLAVGHVPDILKSIGRIIRTQLLQSTNPADVDTELVTGLVAVVRRLNVNRAELPMSVGADHDTGYGIAAIAILEPAAIGQVLADRIGTCYAIIPRGWVKPLTDLPANTNVVMAKSFEEQLRLKQAVGLSELDDFDASQALESLRREASNGNETS